MDNRDFNNTCGRLYEEINEFNILDLGSFNGFDKIWDQLGSKANMIGVDPLIKEETNQNSRRETNFDKIINDKKEKVKFQIAKNLQASSILEINYPLVSRFHQMDQGIITETKLLESDTLNNLLFENNINDLDFIKIDIEGAELKALSTIDKLLENNVLGIQIETFFQLYHIDRPLFSDVYNYLNNLGFKLFDFRDLERWGKKTIDQQYGYGQVMFANSLFFKDPIIDNKEYSLDKIKKLIILSALFDHSDFSIELIKKYNLC